MKKNPFQEFSIFALCILASRFTGWAQPFSAPPAIQEIRLSADKLDIVFSPAASTPQPGAYTLLIAANPSGPWVPLTMRAESIPSGQMIFRSVGAIITPAFYRVTVPSLAISIPPPSLSSLGDIIAQAQTAASIEPIGMPTAKKSSPNAANPSIQNPGASNTLARIANSYRLLTSAPKAMPKGADSPTQAPMSQERLGSLADILEPTKAEAKQNHSKAERDNLETSLDAILRPAQTAALVSRTGAQVAAQNSARDSILNPAAHSKSAAQVDDELLQAKQRGEKLPDIFKPTLQSGNVPDKPMNLPPRPIQPLNPTPDQVIQEN